MISKHFQIAQAIYQTIIADTVCTEIIESQYWKIQRKFYHRGQKWLDGGSVVPIRRSTVPHENDNLLFVMPVLVGVVQPGDGTVRLEDEESSLSLMVISERLEMLFSWQGRNKMAAPLAALGSDGGGVDDYRIEKISCQPGDVYMDGAFQSNYNAYGLVVSVDVLMRKQDFSSLGS